MILKEKFKNYCLSISHDFNEIDFDMLDVGALQALSYEEHHLGFCQTVPLQSPFVEICFSNKGYPFTNEESSNNIHHFVDLLIKRGIPCDNKETLIDKNMHKYTYCMLIDKREFYKSL